MRSFGGGSDGTTDIGVGVAQTLVCFQLFAHYRLKSVLLSPSPETNALLACEAKLTGRFMRTGILAL